MPTFLTVDPRTLHVSPYRLTGADLYKMARRLANYGTAIDTKPPIEVARDAAGRLMIVNGVTRATRVVENHPGLLVTVDVVEDRPGQSFAGLPTVGDLIP
jgi:hypothetical protein